MDMFMDKLAQKLTAQEMIRANTAADTEELNRLRNQIEEYNDCLTKLQRLIDDGTEKFQAFQTKNAELDIEGSVGKISLSLQQNMSQLRECLEELDQKLTVANEPVLKAVAGLEKSLQEKLQQFDNKLEEQLGSKPEEQTDDQLTEKLNVIDENVHKECVKVYRNVQAVILEESEKQKESISKSSSETKGIKKKVGAVLGVSVLALIFSILGIALQVLDILNLLPF